MSDANSKTIKPIPPLSDERISWFWDHVDKTPGHGPQGECWVWTAGKIKSGYGMMRTGPKGVHGSQRCYTHRIAWHLTHGPIGDSLLVLHKCDNPPCCNPDHLFAGSSLDNSRDMASKGRQFLQRDPSRALRGDDHWSRNKPECRAHGIGHGAAKLNEELVFKIRRLRAAGLGASGILQALDLTDICEGTIEGIIYRNTWAHAECEVGLLVSRELQDSIDLHPEINWSDVARKAFAAEVKRLEAT